MQSPGEVFCKKVVLKNFAKFTGKYLCRSLFFNKLINFMKKWLRYKCFSLQKIKFSVKDFFSKCDQIYSFLGIWSHLMKKFLLENFIFCELQIRKICRFTELPHIGTLNKEFVYFSITYGCLRRVIPQSPPGAEKHLWSRHFESNLWCQLYLVFWTFLMKINL